MRRTEKQITDAADIQSVIEQSTVCRLAMVDGEKPYVVPLCFGYQDNALYFHGALKGEKSISFERTIMSVLNSTGSPCPWKRRCLRLEHALSERYRVRNGRFS